MTQPTQADLLLALAQQMETTAKLLRAMTTTPSESMQPSAPCSTATSSVSAEKPKPLLPTQPESKRIAALFRRRLDTPWSKKEAAAYKAAKPTMEELDMIEAYYTTERAKGDSGIHRRDLATFLNNYPGEVDRARAFMDKHKPAIQGYVDPVVAALKGEHE